MPKIKPKKQPRNEFLSTTGECKRSKEKAFFSLPQRTTFKFTIEEQGVIESALREQLKELGDRLFYRRFNYSQKEYAWRIQQLYVILRMFDTVKPKITFK